MIYCLVEHSGLLARLGQVATYSNRDGGKLPDISDKFIHGEITSLLGC